MKLKKNIKIILLIVCMVAVGGTVFGVSRVLGNASTVSVDSFIGQSKSDVETWISENKLEDSQVQYTYEYDEEAEKDTVIAQSIKKGETMTKDDVLEITLSDGPDPDVEFELPDFTDQDEEEIKEWFDDHSFTKVSYEYEKNEELEDGKFISMNPEAGTTVKRSDEVIVKINLIEEGAEVEVPNLNSKSLSEIQSWANDNKITIVIEYENSDSIAKNEIINISASEGTILHEGDRVTVIISLGSNADAREQDNRRASNDTAANASQETKNSNVSSQNTSKTDVSNGKVTDDSNVVEPTPTPSPTPTPTVEPEPQPVYAFIDENMLNLISTSNSSSADAIASAISGYLSGAEFTNVSINIVDDDPSTNMNRFRSISVSGNVEVNTPIYVEIGRKVG